MNSPVLMQSPPIDFHFDSTSTSAYATAPSSPKIFLPDSFYNSPTTPTSSVYGVSPINTDAGDDDFRPTEPFASRDGNQELKNEDYEIEDTDFAFDFSGQLEPPSISDAEDLFHGGKIKPLDPPPMLFSPQVYSKKYFESEGRRERTPTTTTTKHKKSQSLSPAPAVKVSDILSDHQKTTPFNFMWYNKWNLKNLLLFRSTSEGSAVTGDDVVLEKYAKITKSEQDSKNSSFRSCNDGSRSNRRMKRKVSAHEIHYTANRAVAEERRKKTFLPYRSGLLGCLGFSRNLHEMSTRGR